MTKINLKPGGIITEPGSTVKNKTGAWRSLKPIWDEKKCTQCGLCWMYCPDNTIPQKNGKRLETNFDFCKGCGICVEECPVKAIKMVQEEK